MINSKKKNLIVINKLRALYLLLVVIGDTSIKYIISDIRHIIYFSLINNKINYLKSNYKTPKE